MALKLLCNYPLLEMTAFCNSKHLATAMKQTSGKHQATDMQRCSTQS